MNYRSVSDLAQILRNNASKVPQDVDLIVGVPRSGLLAANLLALTINLKFCDVESFISNSPLKHGRTRRVRHPEVIFPHEANHVLVIDDSIDSGESLSRVRSQLSEIGFTGRLTYAACYATPRSRDNIDFFFEIIPHPRLFEWNIMHRPFLQNCCIDIDGVLCLDPSAEENDDGENYRHFLLNAQPLILPSYPLGVLVTGRLEKYRAETDRWLKKHGFVYEKLEMLDLPDAETRRKLGIHASFKADIFRKETEKKLFIESDPIQALNIARLSGKHALCYSTQQFFEPKYSYATLEQKTKNITKRIVSATYRLANRIIGNN